MIVSIAVFSVLSWAACGTALAASLLTDAGPAGVHVVIVVIPNGKIVRAAQHAANIATARSARKSVRRIAAGANKCLAVNLRPMVSTPDLYLDLSVRNQLGSTTSDVLGCILELGPGSSILDPGLDQGSAPGADPLPVPVPGPSALAVFGAMLIAPLPLRPGGACA